jgi:hypothetical protein
LKQGAKVVDKAQMNQQQPQPQQPTK